MTPNNKIPLNRLAIAHELASQVEEWLLAEGQADIAAEAERVRLMLEERLVSEIFDTNL